MQKYRVFRSLKQLSVMYVAAPFVDVHDYTAILKTRTIAGAEPLPRGFLDQMRAHSITIQHSRKMQKSTLSAVPVGRPHWQGKHSRRWASPESIMWVASATGKPAMGRLKTNARHRTDRANGSYLLIKARPPGKPRRSYRSTQLAEISPPAARFSFGREAATLVTVPHTRNRWRGFYQDAGRSTVSITWITPFDCLTSAMVTVAMLP